MKLYLAGPMSGYPDNNIARFDEFACLLRYRGYEVVNPGEFDQTMTYDQLIVSGLLALRWCDGVATHGKWRESNGARSEVQFARSKAMPVRPWFYWDFFSLLWGDHIPAPPARDDHNPKAANCRYWIGDVKGSRIDSECKQCR